MAPVSTAAVSRSVSACSSNVSEWSVFPAKKKLNSTVITCC